MLWNLDGGVRNLHKVSNVVNNCCGTLVRDDKRVLYSRVQPVRVDDMRVLRVS